MKIAYCISCCTDSQQLHRFVKALYVGNSGILELTDNLFESGNKDDLKEKIENMWNNKQKVDKIQQVENLNYKKYLERITGVYKNVSEKKNMENL